MKLTRVVPVGVVAGVLVFSLVQAVAQQRPTVKREPAPTLHSTDPAENYGLYCAVCHGKDGKGNGPAAPAMKTPPTDLTMIAKNNGGKFWAAEVEASIRGRGKTVVAHGTADMPVWGPIFRSMNANDGALTLRINNLVKYIQSMQVK